MTQRPGKLLDHRRQLEDRELPGVAELADEDVRHVRVVVFQVLPG